MRIHTYVPALLALALSACGGAPNEGDIRNAFKSQMSAAMKEADSLPGKNSAFEEMAQESAKQFDALKLVGCKPSEAANGYICDVQLAQLGNTAVPLHLVRVDGEWAIFELAQ